MFAHLQKSLLFNHLPCNITLFQLNHINQLFDDVTGECSESGKPKQSLAYEYGMKIVRGAAKVVSSVADGGKENKNVIENIRNDLDEIHAKHNNQQKQLDNAKVIIIEFCLSK